MNFENLQAKDFEFISELFDNGNIVDQQSHEICQYLRDSKSTSIRSEVFFVYNLSKNVFKSFSLRSKLRTILFGKYRIRNFQSFKQLLRYFLRLKMPLLIIACVYGLFKFPEGFLLQILKIGYSDKRIFSEFTSRINPDLIILFSGGYDNVNFVIDICAKNPNTKYLFVMNNWDNPSSKGFVSKNFDMVCLWNEEQIGHITKLIGIDRNKLRILGSSTADIAYSKYLKDAPSKKSSNHALIFIGQQNSFDEINEVLKIQKLISQGETNFSSLHHRPHPISGRQIKSLSLSMPLLKDVEINNSSDFDLRVYDGIICLPTTLLLEVVLAKKPFVIYTPKNARFRLDPRTMWNYTHFDYFKTLNTTKVVKGFDDLSSLLREGLPTPKDLSFSEFNKIFPYFTENYNSRLLNVLKELSKF
jgi:hypothetical protein